MRDLLRLLLLTVLLIGIVKANEEKERQQQQNEEKNSAAIIKDMKVLEDQNGDKYAAVTHTAKWSDVTKDFVALDEKITFREDVVEDPNVEAIFDPQNRKTIRDWDRDFSNQFVSLI